MNTNRISNRLNKEKSPYLLQHAYNPVDWFPWGEDAFEKAKREDKPVLLSIGYSTCHWCHVMEHESFENEETADILNQGFVSIKVDREERPDIDAVYMAVCVGITGHGGWPLTILMTPGQQPFYAATYLPKKSSGGRMGLDDLLSKVSSVWQTDRDVLLKSASEITDFLGKDAGKQAAHGEPRDELLHHAARLLERGFDEVYGGFGAAPKFPSPHNLLFLMRYYELFGYEHTLRMAEQTLRGMYRGGLYDHIGGGFSHYSTDNKWLVPHFEKMLYDNALLAYVYLHAYELTQNELYLKVAQHTIGYVLRELTHADGGFLCGQDADSDGVEGKYYVLTQEEITTVLGAQDAACFCDWFDITSKGNFEGKSIPNLLKNNDFMRQNDEISALCNTLYEYRRNRTLLHKDDKILTSWNGLMIAALAKAYRVTAERNYLDAAVRAHRFIEEKLTGQSGRLMVRWRDGEGAGNGMLDDYAFYAWALLELYDAKHDAGFLRRACELADAIVRHFSDEQGGGFYLNADDANTLIHRPKELYDGATPSGNSAAGHVLQRLFLLTADTTWKTHSTRQMRYLAAGVQDYPAGYCFALYAMSYALHPPHTLVCATAEADAGEQIARFVRGKGLHDLGVLIKTVENEQTLAQAAPFSKEYPIPRKGSRYYLCRDGACLSPTDSLDALDFTQLTR